MQFWNLLNLAKGNEGFDALPFMTRAFESNLASIPRRHTRMKRCGSGLLIRWWGDVWRGYEALVVHRTGTECTTSDGSSTETPGCPGPRAVRKSRGLGRKRSFERATEEVTSEK